MTYLDTDALIEAHKTLVGPGPDSTYTFGCTCLAVVEGFEKEADARDFERTHLIRAGVRAMEATEAWAALLAERNTWARQMADLHDELDTTRQALTVALEEKSDAVNERDILMARVTEDRAGRIRQSVGAQ